MTFKEISWSFQTNIIEVPNFFGKFGGVVWFPGVGVGLRRSGFIPGFSILTLSLGWNNFRCWISALSSEQKGDWGPRKRVRQSLGFQSYICMAITLLLLHLCVRGPEWQRILKMLLFALYILCLDLGWLMADEGTGALQRHPLWPSLQKGTSSGEMMRWRCLQFVALGALGDISLGTCFVLGGRASRAEDGHRELAGGEPERSV